MNQRATAPVYQNNTRNSSIPKFTGFENASLVKRIWIFTEQSLPSSLVCETKGLIWEAREPSHSLLCIETQNLKEDNTKHKNQKQDKTKHKNYKVDTKIDNAIDAITQNTKHKNHMQSWNSKYNDSIKNT